MGFKKKAQRAHKKAKKRKEEREKREKDKLSKLRDRAARENEATKRAIWDQFVNDFGEPPDTMRIVGPMGWGTEGAGFPDHGKPPCKDPAALSKVVLVKNGIQFWYYCRGNNRRYDETWKMKYKGIMHKGKNMDAVGELLEKVEQRDRAIKKSVIYILIAVILLLTIIL